MSEPVAAGTTDPIVIDLGKVKRKQIKALKQGRGPLVEELAGVVAQVQEGLGSAADGKTVLPVVVVYRQRPKRKKISSLLRL
jgi:hypothetical protein